MEFNARNAYDALVSARSAPVGEAAGVDVVQLARDVVLAEQEFRRAGEYFSGERARDEAREQGLSDWAKGLGWGALAVASVTPFGTLGKVARAARAGQDVFKAGRAVGRAAEVAGRWDIPEGVDDLTRGVLEFQREAGVPFDEALEAVNRTRAAEGFEPVGDVAGVIPRITVRADDVGRVEGAGDYSFRIPDPENPGATKILPGITSEGRIGGRPMTPDEVPDEIYHVTTNAPSVRNSGMLNVSAGGDMGAGGTSGIGAVSTTASRQVAEVLAEDLRAFATLKNMRSADETIEMLLNVSRRQGMSDVQIQGLRERLQAFAAVNRMANFNPAEHAKDIFTQWDYIRGGFGGPDASVIFGSPVSDYWRSVRPEDIDIIPISKSQIPDGALINDYDVGRGGLEEIQVYADIPLAGDVARGAGEVTPELKVVDDLWHEEARLEWLPDWGRPIDEETGEYLGRAEFADQLDDLEDALPGITQFSDDWAYSSSFNGELRDILRTSLAADGEIPSNYSGNSLATGLDLVRKSPPTRAATYRAATFSADEAADLVAGRNLDLPLSSFTYLRGEAVGFMGRSEGGRDVQVLFTLRDGAKAIPIGAIAREVAPIYGEVVTAGRFVVRSVTQDVLTGADATRGMWGLSGRNYLNVELEFVAPFEVVDKGRKSFVSAPSTGGAARSALFVGVLGSPIAKGAVVGGAVGGVAGASAPAEASDGSITSASVPFAAGGIGAGLGAFLGAATAGAAGGVVRMLRPAGRRIAPIPGIQNTVNFGKNDAFPDDVIPMLNSSAIDRGRMKEIDDFIRDDGLLTLIKNESQNASGRATRRYLNLENLQDSFIDDTLYYAYDVDASVPAGEIVMVQNHIDSLLHWQHVGNKNIQSILRTGDLPWYDQEFVAMVDGIPAQHRQTFLDQLYGNAQASVRFLDELTVGSTTSLPFVTYRGANQLSVARSFGDDFMDILRSDPDSLAGFEFEDIAFTTTSLKPGFASWIANVNDEGITEGNILFQIFVPGNRPFTSVSILDFMPQAKSSRGAYYSNEAEILLPRNSVFEVVRVVPPDFIPENPKKMTMVTLRYNGSIIDPVESRRPTGWTIEEIA